MIDQTLQLISQVFSDAQLTFISKKLLNHFFG